MSSITVKLTLIMTQKTTVPAIDEHSWKSTTDEDLNHPATEAADRPRY